MIRVKLYNLLAERSLSGRDQYELPYEIGLRPIDIIRREGFGWWGAELPGCGQTKRPPGGAAFVSSGGAAGT